MKIYAISDLHLSSLVNKPMDIFGGDWSGHYDKICNDWNSKVSDGDLVLISGDLSWAMKMQEALPDINALASLKGEKIIIRGNHDFWWKAISTVRDNLPEHFFAIQNDSLRFGNVLVCGTRGWMIDSPAKTLNDDNMKIYKREVERLKLTLKSMQTIRKPDDKVICMLHYPPFEVSGEDNDFTRLLQEFNVDCVVFGHLHGKYPKCDLVTNRNGVSYYLTSCDRVGFKLVEIVI